MIYTITFNPALDYIIHVPDYAEGAVNRTSDEKILAGGKGINVSTVLKNLGFENTALGFISGFTGEVIEEMLKALEVRSDFIRLDNGFTRINVKIKADRETEINGQGPEISEAAIAELYDRLDRLQDGDILVLAGSIPNTLPNTIYCSIMEHLSGKDLKIIVDATGNLLTDTLKYKPFMIKPNNFELSEIAGRELTTDEEIADGAKMLQNMGAKNVLVSMGGAGALLVTENGDVIRSEAPKGKVINTTGSGDSMVAGFIAGYLESGNYECALKMGLAAGSASAFSENLATGNEVREIYHTIK